MSVLVISEPVNVSRTLFINILRHFNAMTICLGATAVVMENYPTNVCLYQTQTAVTIWNVGVQGAAELDTPKVLAAGSQLSLWFKAHMPDILTTAPQGHSLTLLFLPCLCASDHARHLASLLGTAG